MNERQGAGRDVGYIERRMLTCGRSKRRCMDVVRQDMRVVGVTEGRFRRQSEMETDDLM